MLRFIKGLMQKSSQEEETRLEESELAEWVDNEIDNRLNLFKGTVDKINDKLKESCKSCFKLLDELEEKNLKNENIPEKEKNYMEGNRASFVKNARDFLKQLPQFTAGDFNENMKEMKYKLSNLENANKKPYNILQHFFANEAKKVTQKIKEIEDYSNELNDHYKKLGLFVLEESREELKEEERKQQANKELEKKIREKQEELNEVKEKIEETERKIAQLEERNDYSEYRELSKKKEQILEELNKEISNMENTLSNLKQPLKKNQRLTMDENLNQQFLDAPAKTLFGEDTQRILKFLEGLNKNIEQDKIELKDKKKEKAVSTIQNVNKELIENFKSRYSEKEEERKDIESKLMHNQVMMEYTDLLYKKDHLQEKLDNAQKELSSLQSKLEKNTGNKINEVVEKLNEGLPDKRIVLE